MSFAILQSMVTPILPTIREQTGTDQATVSWIVTAYLVSASVFTPIVGRIGDSVGKRRTLLFTLACLSLGSALAAVSPGVGLIITARAIQGVGGAVLPLSFGIIRDEIPPARVPRGIALSASLLGLGNGTGLVAAGPITERFGYQALFWIAASVTGLAALATAFLVPESRERHPGRINATSGLLMCSWLVPLLLAVSQANEWGWTSPAVIGLWIASLVLLPCWILWESRSQAPLIDMRLLSDPVIWRVNVFGLLFAAAFYAVLAVMPQYLQAPAETGYGYGETLTGSTFLLLPETAGSFITGMIAGRLIAGVGSGRLLVAGSAASCVAYLVLAFSQQQVALFVLGFSLLGLALGLVFTAMVDLVVHSSPSTQTGAATGMNANFRTVGGALGTAVLTTIVLSGGGQVDGLPSASGYRSGLLTLGTVAAGAVLIALLILRRQADTTTGRKANQGSTPTPRAAS